MGNQKETNHGSNRAILELTDVSLKIPIISRETRYLKRALVSSLTGGLIRRTTQGAEIEAIKRITCTIREGERVALIGHNGAGKSTFIRLISGIYLPTSGKIKRYCRVHPMINKSFVTSMELSGTNAVKGYYLLINGNLRGFNSYLEEVVEFSEIGDFIHLPIKGYSEGMMARLLFSLLTSQAHDCLALDEGFGTGDARFFAKAQVRLEDFLRKAGTLLLASHSEGLLQEFCSRGLVFHKGEITFDGDLEDALYFYHHGNI